MGNLVINQAAKFLRERRNTRRWIAVVLCLALVVTSGTFGALTRQGHALSDTNRKLVCAYTPHEHGEGCYNEAGEAVCGYADYCVHTHNESCYDSEGELVCRLPEIEAHVHDESCYQAGQPLVCGLEESDGHHHTDSCYTIQQGEQVCSLEEHTHGEDCYTVSGGDAEMNCGLEEHSHTDECFSWNSVLTCTEEEGAGAHTHSESCYAPSVSGNDLSVSDNDAFPTCGQPELHTHDDSCFAPEDEAHINPICGKIVLEEHIHNEDCFVYAGFELTAEAEGVTLTVSVDKEGVLPENAQVSITPIVKPETPEEETEDAAADNTAYDRILAGLQATLAEDKAKEIVHFLAYEIRFTVENEDGETEQIQPQGPVALTMEFTGAFLPQEIAEKESIQIADVNFAELTADEAGYQAKLRQDAKIETTSESQLQKAELDLNQGGIVALSWVGEMNKYCYEDDQVVITVSAAEEGIIPENARLRVIPIIASGDTVEKYEQVAQKLIEKAENEEYDIAGFLAYDIAFVDEEGNEIEPNGEVKVIMNYKQAVMPEELNQANYALLDEVQEAEPAAEEETAELIQSPVMSADTMAMRPSYAPQNTIGEAGAAEEMEIEAAAEAETTQAEEESVMSIGVTVMHFEEDENGEVAQVVDLAAENKVETLETTEEQAVERTEFVTDGFSTFVITWTVNNFKKGTVTVHYVDENGVEIPGATADEIKVNPDGGEILLQETTIAGYKFSKITVDKVNGIEISKLKYTSVTTGEVGNESMSYHIQYNSGSWNEDAHGNSKWQNASSNETWVDWKTIHSNATSGDVYIVYNKIPTTPISVVSDAPGHNKYIRYNENDKDDKNDDDYTVTLDVTGKRGEAQGVDVLFVIDKSGSMDDEIWIGYERTNLLAEFKKTAENVIPSIVPNGTANKVAAVSFSSKNYGSDINTSWEGHTSGTNPVISKINSLSANGGTNWQLAMRKAENKLAEVASDDNLKVVIFISDGKPTHYYENTSTSTSETKNNNDPDTAISRAVNEVGRSTYLKNAKVYSVYLTIGTQNSMTKFADKLKDNGVDATAINGTNLETSITDLVNKIISPVFEEVVIEDTLSEFVEFTDLDKNGKPKFEVWYKQVGENNNVSWGRVDEDKYTVQYPVDSNNKKFALTFKYDATNKDGILDPDITYSISYKVKTSDVAKEAYRNNDFDYPSSMKGDKNTDAPARENIPGLDNNLPANATSSEKGGFYSNELAVLKYKEKDGTEKVSEYPHPVVQVNMERPVESNLEFDKTATVKNWDDRTYDINIVAASKMTSTTTTEGSKTADIMMVFDMSGSMNNDASGKELGTNQWDNRVGKFVDVSGKLNTTELYYYSNVVEGNSYSEIKYRKQPMIYLDGAWQYYKNDQWNKISDGDQNYIYQFPSKLTMLKNAATTFITSVATSSPNSTIGIATYNSYKGSNGREVPQGILVSGLVAAGNKKNDLVQKVNALYADGGTHMEEGLDIAKEQLAIKRENVSQYVVIFSDGKTANPDNAEVYAKGLKDAGVTVYTIGFGLGDEEKDWLEKNIASPGCALTADNTDDLGKIFQTIQETITQSAEIKNAEIRDTIDPRFVILDDAGIPIVASEEEGAKYKKEDIEKGVTLANGGTVYLDSDGKQYIKWPEQTIPGAKDGVWSRTITVKAKPDYIGGNNVPTNVPGPGNSYISIGGYGTAILPLPEVNVKVELPVENAEVTIYKGDTVPTEVNVLNKLFDKEEVAKKHNLDPNSFTLEWYKAYDSSTKEFTAPVTDEEMKEFVPESEETVFYLKVTYKAGEPTKESNANTTLNNEVHAVGKAPSYEEVGVGTYTIKVISGEINIVKKLTEAPEEDKEFTFIISKLIEEKEASTNAVESQDDVTDSEVTEEQSDGAAVEDQSNSELVTNAEQKPEYVKIAEVKITVKAGTTEGKLQDVQSLLKNLSRGTYKVEEAEHNEYAMKELQNDSTTDCYVEKTSETIIFKLGYDVSGEDVISKEYAYTNGGTLGKAVFTNEAVIGDLNIVKKSSSATETGEEISLAGAEFTMTADGKVAYIGVSDANGEVKWYHAVTGEDGQVQKGEALNKENLNAGTYILSEIKAPAGYARSEETWTIEIASNGKLKSISDNAIIKEKEGIFYYYFYNDPVYALPSTGGEGIYWYSIGGTLLMLAGALILYRNKKREEEVSASRGKC